MGEPLYPASRGRNIAPHTPSQGNGPAHVAPRNAAQVLLFFLFYFLFFFFVYVSILIRKCIYICGIKNKPTIIKTKYLYVNNILFIWMIFQMWTFMVFEFFSKNMIFYCLNDFLIITFISFERFSKHKQLCYSNEFSRKHLSYLNDFKNMNNYVIWTNFQ